MKKSMYIMGSVEVILGVLILSMTSMIKELMPAIGYAAFQSAAAGSYTSGSYELSFGFANTLAILLIVAGAVQIFWGFCKGKTE